MPLTLEETKLLIAALGLKIAEGILDQKAKGEEFKARQEDKSRCGQKAGRMALQKDFGDLLTHANSEAGNQRSSMQHWSCWMSPKKCCTGQIHRRLHLRFSRRSFPWRRRPRRMCLRP